MEILLENMEVERKKPMIKYFKRLYILSPIDSAHVLYDQSIKSIKNNRISQYYIRVEEFNVIEYIDKYVYETDTHIYYKKVISKSMDGIFEEENTITEDEYQNNIKNMVGIFLVRDEYIIQDSIFCFKWIKPDILSDICVCEVNLINEYAYNKFKFPFSAIEITGIQELKLENIAVYPNIAYNYISKLIDCF